MRAALHLFLFLIVLPIFEGNTAFAYRVISAKKVSAVTIPSVRLGNWALSGQKNAQETRAQWAPPDVNDIAPPVSPGVSCLLSDLLPKAGEKVIELIQNVDRFTATETIQHRGVDRSGRLGKPETDKFNYAASFSAMNDGYIHVEEFRKGRNDSDPSLGGVAAIGMSSLILIFHPLYAIGFDMQCEGLGEWRGEPAWQVSFEQSRTAINRTCAIDVGPRSFDLRLRGRAWILASSYQVAELQVDLADPIEKIRLRLYHQENEYGPVRFPGTESQIWLPLRVQLYLDFSHHRFYRQHNFTDFRLFSVRTQQMTTGPM
jgi:hypothetical protein